MLAAQKEPERSIVERGEKEGRKTTPARVRAEKRKRERRQRGDGVIVEERCGG